MSLWESATTPSSPRARAAEAAAGSVTKTWARRGAAGGGGSVTRTWSRGGRSREARQREAPAVEGYLERWSDSRQRFVRVWAALRMDLDGRPPSLVYAVGDDGAAATTPRSILKVSGRHTSPERGSIPVDEIRDVRMGFATPPAMDTSSPNCEFQLTRSAAEGAKMILLRSATKAECQSWVAALGIARGSSWRKHQAESALPPGWKAATDRRGRTYYYEKASGTRSWKHPTTGRPGPQLDIPANEYLLDLRVEVAGFFGVMFEEEVDPFTQREYVRVASVSQGSLAFKALPGLQSGWLLHSAQGRAVGYLGTAAASQLLKERPLTVVFADGPGLVDMAAEEEVEVRSILEQWGRPELSSAAVRVMRRKGIGSGPRIHLNKREWTTYLLGLSDSSAGLPEFFAECEEDASAWQASVSGGGPGGLAQQQQERRDAELTLRTELASLGLSGLQRRAVATGSPQASIDSALDSTSPKEALVSLVVSAELDKTEGETSLEEGVPPDEHPPSAEEAHATLAAMGLLDGPTEALARYPNTSSLPAGATTMPSASAGRGSGGVSGRGLGQSSASVGGRGSGGRGSPLTSRIQGRGRGRGRGPPPGYESPSAKAAREAKEQAEKDQVEKEEREAAEAAAKQKAEAEAAAEAKRQEITQQIETLQAEATTQLADGEAAIGQSDWESAITCFKMGLARCDEAKAILFQSLDTNGDGEVSMEEFAAGMSLLGETVSQAKNDKLRTSLETALADAENLLAEEQAAREERERLDALENERVEALLALRKTCMEWGDMTSWDAASVIKWAEMAALPKDEHGALLPPIRKVFESMDMDGEDLTDLKSKGLIKALGKAGAEDAEGLAREILQQRDAVEGPEPEYVGQRSPGRDRRGAVIGASKADGIETRGRASTAVVDADAVARLPLPAESDAGAASEPNQQPEPELKPETEPEPEPEQEAEQHPAQEPEPEPEPEQEAEQHPAQEPEPEPEPEQEAEQHPAQEPEPKPDRQQTASEETSLSDAQQKVDADHEVSSEKVEDLRSSRAKRGGQAPPSKGRGKGGRSSKDGSSEKANTPSPEPEGIEV